MRILGIYLDGIQSYTVPTRIPLSPDKTVIKGKNDVGKSTLKKVIFLFSGIYSTARDVISLINFDRDAATCGLYLDNRTVLLAHIYSTGTVEYSLWNWQLNICFRKWVGYSSEIERYLKWSVVPEECLCLNMISSKLQLFVSTNAKMNTNIVNTIGVNPDIDSRLVNMDNAIDELKSVQKISGDQKNLIQKRLVGEYYDVEQLAQYRGDMEFLINQASISNQLEIIIMKLYKMYYLKYQLYCIQLYKQIEDISSMTNKLKTLNDYKDRFQKLNVLVFAQLSQGIITRTLQLNNTKNNYTDLQSLHTVSKELQSANTYVQLLNFIINRLTLVRQLHEQSDRLRSLQLILKTNEIINNLTNYTAAVDNLNSLHAYSKLYQSSITGIQQVSQALKLINNITSCIQQRDKLHKLVNIQNQLNQLGLPKDIITKLETMNSLITDYKDIVSQKSKYNVCPLCKQELPHTSCSHTTTHA